MIHEEADWCFRGQKKGFRPTTVTAACVYHKSQGTLKDFPAMTHYYSVRNFLYLAKRNASFLEKIITAIGLFLHALRNLFWLVFGSAKDKVRARVFFLAVNDFFTGRMGKTAREFKA